MAGSIKLKLGITASYGSGALSLDHSRSLTVTTAGDHPHATVQDVGFAAHEALVIPAEIGTAGWAWFQNMDATNFVQIGLDVSAAFVPFAKLLPGEATAIRLSTDAIYAKADTGAVKLYFLITEA
jgi:hypothetical protein